jgi:hypothetical protein
MGDAGSTVQQILVEIPEGKRSRCRWENNTRKDLRDVGWEGVDWIYVVQDSDQWWDAVNVTMNLLLI